MKEGKSVIEAISETIAHAVDDNNFVLPLAEQAYRFRPQAKPLYEKTGL